MDDTMGIDISKDTLDAYWLSKREHKQFANTKNRPWVRASAGYDRRRRC